LNPGDGLIRIGGDKGWINVGGIRSVSAKLLTVERLNYIVGENSHSGTQFFNRLIDYSRITESNNRWLRVGF
jgi:hypothetical protein